jgi:hypothetical protein
VRVKAENGATVQAGTIMVARCVAAGGRLGIAWRSHGRAVGEEEQDRERKRATRGGDLSRRWRGGGGRAAARGAALPAAGEQSRATCARKKKRGEEIWGTSLRFLESSRTSR